MKVRLYYLFSKNNKIGSKIISWFSGLLVKDLEKIPSHMAVLIEGEGSIEPLVFESTLTSGVRILPYKNWLTINEECYKVPCKKEKTHAEVFSYVYKYWGRKYDWAGVAYFGWCFLKHYLFKSPFPEENAWQSDEKYFCNELGGEISGYEKYSMVTPAKMCSDFLKM